MQVGFVKAEIIVGQKAFQSRIDFDVVVEINRVNVTATIVDVAFELMWEKRLNKQLIRLRERKLLHVHVNQIC